MKDDRELDLVTVKLDGMPPTLLSRADEVIE
jgi:hypothetical protein